MVQVISLVDVIWVLSHLIGCNRLKSSAACDILGCYISLLSFLDFFCFCDFLDGILTLTLATGLRIA